MTNPSAFDLLAQVTAQIDLIAPADQQLDAYALRLRQADLARLLGCSRQVLNQWVQRGHIRLDSDGRIDARRAVVQVLEANLRGAPIQAKAVAPVLEALKATADRIAGLEFELARVSSSCDESLDWCDQLEDALDQLAKFLRAHEDALDERPGRTLCRQIANWAENARYADDVPDLAAAMGMCWVNEPLHDAGEPCPEGGDNLEPDHD